MSNKDKENLINAGVDLDDALPRFMDSDIIYCRFLKLFLIDQSFAKLQNSIESGDLKDAYSHAHTLKGVASNLSFSKLIKTLMPIHNCLKDGVNKDYTQDIAKLSDQYNKLVKIIKVIE